MPPAAATHSPLMRRWAMVVLCALNTFVAYCDRVNVSVAVLGMRQELQWDIAAQGRVLGAFFWGYAPSQLVGSHLALRFGGKAVLLGITLVWSCLTIMTPHLARLGTVEVIVACRFVLGLTEGCVFPTVFHFLAGWVEGQERSRSVALAASGGMFGTVFAFLVSPLLMKHCGWHAVFYSFGCLGMAWCLAWWKYAEDPQPSPCSAAVLPGHTDAEPPQGLRARSILSVLRTRSCLAIFVAHSAWTFCFFIVVAWLPTYLDALGLRSDSLAVAACPYALQAVVANVAGQMADAQIVAGRDRVTVRRIFTLAGMVPAILSFVLLALVPVSGYTAICVLVVAMGGGGFVFGGYEAYKLDVVPPQLAGTLQGMSSMIACFAGAVGVPLAGAVRTNLGSWSGAFLMMALVNAAGALGFVLLTVDAQVVGEAKRPAPLPATPVSRSSTPRVGGTPNRSPASVNSRA
eukprot:TRINITY_DN21574_c0_g1_i1.p1 TRINITY_DN21574_c0_g1~~TRINITY_DN21574_c0_g1_i1.p1  ORF type:complete len:460 (+),score=147.06 TRINITY_DN21574_c0_g1_i1:77-1456(+)